MNYKKNIIGSGFAFLIATSCCWLPAAIIAMGGGSTIIALSNGLEQFSAWFMAAGVGLLGQGSYQFYKRKKHEMENEVILQSIITCPHCRHKKEETMPSNACQFFYECDNCKEVLKPKKGDCCVYCSYGTVACPPIQLNQDCC